MAAELDLLWKSGKVFKWWFEGITLRLAKATRYTPDFLVMMADQLWACF